MKVSIKNIKDAWDRFLCNHRGHDWKLTYSKWGNTKEGWPIRDVEYTCQRKGCGTIYKNQRLAFSLGSGALEYISLPGDKVPCRRIE